MRARLSPSILMAVLALVLVPTAALSHGGPRLVVDTDMGLDDARALFALLADDALDVEAIIVTEGSASREHGITNLFGLLAAAGKTHMPVFLGAKIDAAPPWRETANSLGRFAPRAAGVGAAKVLPLDDLPALLMEEGDVVYLALGPLGSLAELARNHHEAFSRIATICIPVRSEGDGIRAWNLSADPRAAGIVFERAREIVLVDVSAGSAAAEGLLASIIRETPATRFARNTIAANESGAHAFLCDELAAAYAMNRSVASAELEPFRLEIQEKSLSLVPDGRGTVRLARIDEPAAATAVLIRRWERMLHVGGAAESEDIPVVRLLRAFHGHLGPYVVLGYRMGRAALEATGCEGHFDISAEIHSFLEPPRSCLIDGVQLGTGCTLGKRNIELSATDGPAWGAFAAKNGNTAVVRLRPEVTALVDSLIRTVGVERAGERLLEAPAADLFTIEAPAAARSARRRRRRPCRAEAPCRDGFELTCPAAHPRLGSA